MAVITLNRTFIELDELVNDYSANFTLNLDIISNINLGSLSKLPLFTSELTVLSFGAGQDTTTILLLLIYNKEFRNKYAPKNLVVIFSDTGNEHPSTYFHIKKMEKVAEENGIEFIVISNDKGFHSENWMDLKSFYKRTNTVGSKAFRKTCTDNLKIKPIYRFLEEYIAKKYDLNKGRKKAFKEFAEKHGKILMIIGITKGEESRVAKKSDKDPKWKKLSIEMSYPLIEVGMDRLICQSYIRSLNYIIPMPSNCMICPYLSEIELVWLFKFYPEEYYDWIEFEKAKIDKYSYLEPEKNLGVWGKKLLPTVLEKALNKYGHLTEEELFDYKMSHGHCVKSKY